MYLHEEMEGMDGEFYRMAGVIPGRAYRTPRLSRFGYVTLRQRNKVFGTDDLGGIPAHEFHYFDSENCGETFLAVKPESSRSWNCIHGTDTMLAGFPHLYYYGNPKMSGFSQAVRPSKKHGRTFRKTIKGENSCYIIS